MATSPLLLLRLLQLRHRLLHQWVQVSQLRLHWQVTSGKFRLSAGQAVQEGDVLVILEAMKMETEVRAARAGTVASVDVKEGDAVQVGDSSAVSGVRYCSMDKLIDLFLASGAYNITGGQVVMIFVGFLLLYLAIKKNFEPLLLVPIGFGGIMANIPEAGLGVLLQ